MTTRWDPQVSGPRPLGALLAEPAARAVTVAVSDLNASSPLADLRDLLTRPRQFFAFFRETERLSAWLYAKALGGYFVFSWLAQWLWNGPRGRAWFARLLDNIDPRLIFYVEHRLGVSGLKSKIFFLLMSMQQLKLMAAPLFSFLQLLVWAGATSLALLFFGAPQSSRSFPRLLLVGCFVGWLQVLVLVPGGFSEPLSHLWMGLLSIFAVKWAYDQSFWRSLVATHLLSGIVALFGTALLLAFSLALSSVL